MRSEPSGKRIQRDPYPLGPWEVQPEASDLKGGPPVTRPAPQYQVSGLQTVGKKSLLLTSHPSCVVSLQPPKWSETVPLPISTLTSLKSLSSRSASLCGQLPESSSSARISLPTSSHHLCRENVETLCAETPGAL